LAIDSRKHKADAQFRKMQRAEDGKKAMSEYEASAAAIRTKTARLKALRLARDAQEQAAPAAPATTSKRAKKATATV